MLGLTAPWGGKLRVTKVELPESWLGVASPLRTPMTELEHTVTARARDGTTAEGKKLALWSRVRSTKQLLISFCRHCSLEA